MRKPEYIPSHERIAKLTKRYKRRRLSQLRRNHNLPQRSKGSGIRTAKCVELELDPVYLDSQFGEVRY